MKVFVEEQRFTQLWLHIVLVVSFIVPIIMVVKEYIESSNRTNESLLGLLIVSGSIVFVYALIFSLKLKTRIDEKGIHFRFVPFHVRYKLISWNELAKAYVREYEAISEYGGWGMKGGALWRKNKGIAYNVKGNIGLQLELKSGKKILIGTQKEADVIRVLKTYTDEKDNL